MYEPSLGEEIADAYKDIYKKFHRIDSIIERLELKRCAECLVPPKIPTLWSRAIRTNRKQLTSVRGREVNYTARFLILAQRAFGLGRVPSLREIDSLGAELRIK